MATEDMVILTRESQECDLAMATPIMTMMITKLVSMSGSAMAMGSHPSVCRPRHCRGAGHPFLLNTAGLAKIGELRALVALLLVLPVELDQTVYRHIQLCPWESSREVQQLPGAISSLTVEPPCFCAA